MLRLMGEYTDFVDFEKNVSKFFSDWSFEITDRDDIFLATFASTLLLLKREGLLEYVTDEDPISILPSVIEKHYDKFLKTEDETTCTFIKNLTSTIKEIISEYNSYTKGKDPESVIRLCNYLQSLSKDFDCEGAFLKIAYALSCQKTIAKSECIYNPLELTDLALRLVRVKSGESICNPYAGTATYSNLLPMDVDYIGEEPNRDLWKLGMLNLAIQGRYNSVFNNIEPLNKFLSAEVDEELRYVTTPPFSFSSYVTWKEWYYTTEQEYDENGNLKRSVSIPSSWKKHKDYLEDGLFYFCRELSYHVMKPTCYIVPDRVIYNKSEDFKFLRRYISTMDDIQALILLPSILFKGKSELLALVVQDEEILRETEDIRLIDATHCYFKDELNEYHLDVEKVLALYAQDEQDDKVIIVSQKELEDHSYSWDASEYRRDRIENADHTGYENIPLHELVKYYHTMDSTEDTGLARCITFRELSRHPFEALQVEEIPMRTLSNQYYKLTGSGILVSLKNDLKPTVFILNEDIPTYVSMDITFLMLEEEDINSKVDIEYLLLKLSEIRLEHYAENSLFPEITLENLFNIKIPICSIDRQKEIATAARLQYDKFLNEKYGLEQTVEKMKSDYMNEVRTRKHDMMPHLRQLSCAQENIEIMLQRKDTMSNEEFVNEVMEELRYQKTAINTLTELLKVFSSEQEFGEPEIIDICKFLNEKYTDGRNFKVSHYIDSSVFLTLGIDEARVEIAEYDLIRLCDNILQNAIKHGFTDESRKDYKFWTSISINKEKRMFVIDFCNNGNPLPKGLDSECYGIRGYKAGDNAGTGEGGHTVKSIVEHYGGMYEIFSSENALSPVTTIRVYLPINNNK